MDELKNLQEISSLASGRMNQYDGEDFELPSEFKERVTEINSNKVTYNTYTAIIETRGNQHGILNIFMPNQWFYIASYFTDFYNELLTYKKYALMVTSKDRLKAIGQNNLKLNEQEDEMLQKLNLSAISKERLKKFITDYRWWGGAKTIDRGDFYVSPILNSASLVNASQSFVADLCAFLADKHDLVSLILDKERRSTEERLGKAPVQASLEGNIRFIDALKTKPFLLLAGISGTGKSRKVQELAYATCPRDGELDTDPTSPGNYCLIEVKPNWHDSTELLGYYSNISGKYMLTDFVRFVYKATQHPDVPFFLCLDEMNLAPVEQYFAEYLSVLETRKSVRNEQTGKTEIQSAELITKKSFENINVRSIEHIPVDSYGDDVPSDRELLYHGDDLAVIQYIKANGLRLPQNLFVIGTVNMDDTTHQFSRKVIDRAFTIEMNGGNLSSMFDAKDTLAYAEKPLDGDAIIPSFAKAQEVLDEFPDDAVHIKELVPERLNYINGENIFKDTPFRVSYRVENELILYFGSLRKLDHESPTEELVNKAFLAVLLEKVLPRVEGDEKAMKCGTDGYSTILNNLQTYVDSFKSEDYSEGDGSVYDVITHKLHEMNERVKNSYFTSFFS